MDPFNLTAMVQFLQLIFIHLPPDILVLVSETSTLQFLNDVHDELNSTLPVLKFSFNETNEQQGYDYCHHCTRNQLTIFAMPIDQLKLASRFVGLKFFESNRVLFLFTKQLNAQEEFAVFDSQKILNVMVVQPNGPLVRLLVCRFFTFLTQTQRFELRTYFDEPTQLFHSNDTNAMVFRRQLKHWSASTSQVRMTVVLMAPYNFLIREQRSGQTQLASSMIAAFQIIAKHFGFAMRVDFQEKILPCPDCSIPLVLRENRRRIPLFPLKVSAPKP